jgi:hypothetical protein
MDSNHNIYCYGDEYRSNGSIIIRFGKTTLNTLTWEDWGETGTHHYRT